MPLARTGASLVNASPFAEMHMKDVAAVLDGSAEALAASNRWLQRFEAAVGHATPPSWQRCLRRNATYRDLLAFSWTIRPSQGAEAIAGFLAGAQPTILARDYAVAGLYAAADGATAGHRGDRGDFRFDTAVVGERRR